MARSSIWLYTGGKVPSKAVVSSQTDTTATALPELILGTSEVFTFNFTDGTNVAPSFCNANTHTLSVAISTCEAGDVEPLFYTDNFAQTATGWSGQIALTTASLYAHVSADAAVTETVPKSRLWLQATVTRTADSQRTAYALAQVYVWARTTPDTLPQNTVTPAKRFEQWAEEVASNVAAAALSALAASASASSAGSSAQTSQASSLSAASSASAASGFSNSAAQSLTAIQQLANQASLFANAAAASAASANGASSNAQTYASNALSSETNAAASALLAQQTAANTVSLVEQNTNTATFVFGAHYTLTNSTGRYAAVEITYT